MKQITFKELTKKFYAAWDECKSMHNQILDTYVNNLYEESWDMIMISSFRNLLSMYNESMKKLYNIIHLIPWDNFDNGAEVKQKFLDKFKNVFVEDIVSWNAIELRCKYYEKYRKNRNSIILSINSVQNWVETEYKQLLEFFINECNNVPLYKDVKVVLEKPKSDINSLNDVTVRLQKTPELCSQWLKDNKSRVLDKIANDTTVLKHYLWSEVQFVFKQYIKLRKVAYNIFCGLTSAEEIRGAVSFGEFDVTSLKGIGNYQYIAKYCMCQLTDRTLKNLINTYREYEISYDDEYQQIMDMRSRQYMNMNESIYPFIDFYSPTQIGSRDNVLGMSMHRTDNSVGRICSDGMDVYSMTKFRIGDIIERCPCREIRDISSLYSRDVRDMALRIRETGQYVIPMGYCQYYAIASNGYETNCEYEWDSMSSSIIIRATKPIQKGEKLVLLKC